MELHSLINKYGEPQALIDSWDKFSTPYAIWGFEEQFILNSDGKVIKNGNYSDEPFLESLQKTLDKWKSNNGELAAVGIISYDL